MKGSERFEYKYVLSPAEYFIIRHKISRVMDVDENTASERYHVRSLYFENPQRSSFTDKVTGIYHRHKYRLRMYQYDPRTLRFEQKEKHGDLIRKKTIHLDVTEGKKIAAGDYSSLLERGYTSIYADLTANLYLPFLIIDYLREPYVLNPGNIRITFDLDIHSRHSTGRFFQKNLPGVPLMEGNLVVMELKFSGWLPVWLKNVIQHNIPGRQSVSKYCLGFYNNPIIR